MPKYSRFVIDHELTDTGVIENDIPLTTTTWSYAADVVNDRGEFIQTVQGHGYATPLDAFDAIRSLLAAN